MFGNPKKLQQNEEYEDIEEILTSNAETIVSTNNMALVTEVTNYNVDYVKSVEVVAIIKLPSNVKNIVSQINNDGYSINVDFEWSEDMYKFETRIDDMLRRTNGGHDAINGLINKTF